jgi:hypothetical protein
VNVKELLNDTTARASEYLASLDGRRVAPDSEQIARLQALAGTLPEESSNPMSVLALLDDYGSPATVASAGGRYFGFVTGGTLPAALAAKMQASGFNLRLRHFSKKSPPIGCAMFSGFLPLAALVS